MEKGKPLKLWVCFKYKRPNPCVKCHRHDCEHPNEFYSKPIKNGREHNSAMARFRRSLASWGDNVIRARVYDDGICIEAYESTSRTDIPAAALQFSHVPGLQSVVV